jgi:hypothetical protein
MIVRPQKRKFENIHHRTFSSHFPLGTRHCDFLDEEITHIIKFSYRSMAFLIAFLNPILNFSLIDWLESY